MNNPNKGKAQLQAQKLLKRYYLSDPSRVELSHLLGMENILLEFRELKACSGNLVRFKNRGSITVSSSVQSLKRRRFIISHELGHWILHKDVPVFSCTNSDMLMWHDSGSKYEIEANQFASEFLMPTNLFKNESNGQPFGADLIKHLANRFNTSATSTSIKYTDCGSIPIVVILSRDNRASWHKPSFTFQWSFYEKYFEIPEGTLTRSYHQSRNIRKNVSVVLASKWFTKDYSVKPDHYLYEAIIPMPKYNSCLTYLWNHELNFTNI